MRTGLVQMVADSPATRCAESVCYLCANTQCRSVLGALFWPSWPAHTAIMDTFTTLYPFSQEPPDQLRVAFLRLSDGCVQRSACRSLCVGKHRNPWTLGREMAQIRLFSHPNVRNFLRFRGCMVFVACKSLILLNSAFFDAHILGLLFHIFVLYFHLLAFFSTSHF